MLERVLAEGLIAPRHPGRGDALGRARLGLHARPRGARRPVPDAVDGAARQLRPARRLRRGRAPLRRALRAARRRAGGRAPAAARGARQPAGLGARQPLRGRRRARRAPAGRRSSPATPPTTRSRRSSTGSPPRPAAAPCWGCGRTTAAWPGRCSASPGPRSPPTASSAAWPGARTPATRSPPTPATASATACCRSWRRSTRPRPRTCCAPRRCCATRPRCSTPWSTPSSTARTARARGTIALARLAELPPALRRLVLQRLADGAAGRPVPGAARFAEQVAGLRRTGSAMLDLGGGVRAVVEARRPPRRAGLSGRWAGSVRNWTYSARRRCPLYLDCGG